jgi:chemotaxis protein MotB
MSRVAKAVAVTLTVAAAASGAVAWNATTEGRHRTDAQRSLTEKCQTELSACATERKDREKAANEVAATLSASRAEIDELRAEHAAAEQRLATFKALTEKFQKMIDSGKLQILLRHGRMVVKLPAGVLFASGSAELSKEGKDALREVATILKHVRDRQFMVAGHTDSLPIDPKAVPPSPFKNNLELSTARSVMVAEQLIASGMNPARLVAAGYGEHEPVQSNAHEAGRQENRRIEIVLLPNVTEVPGASAADGGAPDGGANDGGANDGG